MFIFENLATINKKIQLFFSYNYTQYTMEAIHLFMSLFLFHKKY